MNTWGISNNCIGQSQHFPTRYDGQNGFWCIAPEGTCRQGGPVVRCSFNGGHTWPFATTLQWATLVWEFFSNNPLLLAEEMELSTTTPGGPALQ
jgi:hypothetical protein